MSTIVSTALITAPLAFLAGWILSKVIFRHIPLTRPITPGAPLSPEAGAAEIVAGDSAGPGPSSANETENAPNDGRRVNILRQKLAGALAETQSLRSETQLLKEAAAEREHTVLTLKRKLQAQLMVPEDSLTASSARQKQFVQMLEDRLATSEHSLKELKHELDAAHTRARRATRRFHKWRQKFKPMARQFRQQRKIVIELREELRRRDLEQQELDAARSKGLVEQAVAHPAENTPLQSGASPEAHASSSAAPADDGCMTAADPASTFGDEEREDLQTLRGIGPALHKKLNEKGIYRLRQLAFMSPQELNKLGKSLGVSKKLIVRHNWTRQARLLLKMPELPADEKVGA